VLEEAMATRPEDRFKTAAEFADALESSLQSRRRLRIPRWRLSWRLLLIFALALANFSQLRDNPEFRQLVNGRKCELKQQITPELIEDGRFRPWFGTVSLSLLSDAEVTA
jgi:hypothetical protein